MNRDAILALEGRELDAALAEALGWQWWTNDEVSLLHSPDDSEELRDAIGKGLMPKWRAGKEGAPNFRNVPPYSSTWKGMELIADELKRRNCDELDINYCLSSPEHERWSVALWGPSGDAIASGETAPLAVARAALLALQEEE